MHITTITHNSPLGSWTHSECEPDRSRTDVLSGVVEKMWHFEGRMALLRERSFPRVYSEIILQLGPRFREVSADGTPLDYFPAACFGGATTAPSVIEAPDSVCCVIGIQLSAPAAFRLLGFSPGRANDITISLQDAFGSDAEFLAEQCHDAHSVAQRFSTVARFLQQRMSSPRTPAVTTSLRAVEWVAHELRRNQGQTSIASLQQQTAFSRAKFVSVFRETTGFAPKHYARILRFRHVLQLLQQGRKLSDAAFTAGYYDQAHMQNEFTEFAHMTPASFVSALRFPNSMSLPE